MELVLDCERDGLDAVCGILEACAPGLCSSGTMW